MPHSAQVLTVAQMRAAERALIDDGESVESLMERAGAGAADWVWRDIATAVAPEDPPPTRKP